MRLSASELSSIEEQASNLCERLSGEYAAAKSDTPLAHRRLSKWQELSVGSWERQKHALTPSEEVVSPLGSRVQSLLGPVTKGQEHPPAPWVSRLNGIVAAVAASFTIKPHPEHPMHRRWKIPYQHLFLPIADHAWSHIMAVHNEDLSKLGEGVRTGLQEMLVRRISGIASNILQTRFLAHCSVSDSGMMEHLFGSENFAETAQGGTGQYKKFITEQGEDGLHSLFTGFPVASRLISEVTQYWIEFVGEFLSRFEDDRAALAKEFNGGAPLAPSCAIEGNLSDPHHMGRSVLIVNVQHGPRLVYKPRPTQIDLAFNALLTAVNTLAPDPGLRVLKVCEREDHGWMEFARHDACTSRRAASRFYHRAGMLACLAHWLRGIDFHRENVVASGDHPVLVDLEALCHPLRAGELVNSDKTPPWPLAGSVLRPGLLPIRQTRFTGMGSYDNSGLGASVVVSGLFPGPAWTDVNTDLMQVCQKSSSKKYRTHRPTLKGRVLSVHAFQADVLAGYKRMTNLLQGRHAAKLSRYREIICAATRRRIKRHTLLYKVLIMHSLQPECLVSGVDRSITFQALPCEPGHEADWRSEIASLERLDVPYFQINGYTSEHYPPNIEPQPASWDAQENLVRLSLKRKLLNRNGLIYKL